MTTLNTNFRAGVLVRRPVRNYLDECQFNGRLVEYKEIRGWLDSNFLIKGMDEQAWNDLVQWSEELGTRK